MMRPSSAMIAWPAETQVTFVGQRLSDATRRNSRSRSLLAKWAPWPTWSTTGRSSGTLTGLRHETTPRTTVTRSKACHALRRTRSLRSARTASGGSDARGRVTSRDSSAGRRHRTGLPKGGNRHGTVSGVWHGRGYGERARDERLPGAHVLLLLGRVQAEVRPGAAALPGAESPVARHRAPAQGAPDGGDG